MNDGTRYVWPQWTGPSDVEIDRALAAAVDVIRVTSADLGPAERRGLAAYGQLVAASRFVGGVDFEVHVIGHRMEAWRRGKLIAWRTLQVFEGGR